MTSEERKYSCKDCIFDNCMTGIDPNISAHWCRLYCSPKINLEDGPICDYFKPVEAES